jgi:hypothetical protein
MDPFYFDLAAAAEWIWNHRNEPQYWEWDDLTEANPANDALKLHKATAWNVVTVLESKGLIRFMEPFEKDGKSIKYPFRIDLSDSYAWKQIRKPPTKCNRILSYLYNFGSVFWYFILWTISLVIASSLTYGMQRIIDWLWPVQNG